MPCSLVETCHFRWTCCLHLLPWRLRQHIPSGPQWISIWLHSITFKETVYFTVITRCTQALGARLWQLNLYSAPNICGSSARSFLSHHPSGVQNFEVPPSFLESMCTPLYHHYNLGYDINQLYDQHQKRCISPNVYQSNGATKYNVCHHFRLCD